LKLYLLTFVQESHYLKKIKMKCFKLIVLFALVSFGVSSCSMGGSHTRCAAYAINDSTDELVDHTKEIESKELIKTELLY